MAWFEFRKKNYTSPEQPRPDVVEADPQAFAPIPAPAPYQPVDMGTGDLPPGRTFIEKAWPNRVGNEEFIPPVKRGRYRLDSEYRRDMDTAVPDGLGRKSDVYDTAVTQSVLPDVRLAGVNPDLGKRPMSVVGSQSIYNYFRHFEGLFARHLDGSHGSIAEIIPGEVVQGNYAPRSWRLTDRQDPLDADPVDYAGSAASAMSQHYTYAGVRRSFRR